MCKGASWWNDYTSSIFHFSNVTLFLSSCQEGVCRHTAVFLWPVVGMCLVMCCWCVVGVSMPHSCPKAKRDQFPSQHAFLSRTRPIKGGLQPWSQRLWDCHSPVTTLETVRTSLLLLFNPNDYIQLQETKQWLIILSLLINWFSLISSLRVHIYIEIIKSCHHLDLLLNSKQMAVWK